MNHSGTLLAALLFINIFVCAASSGITFTKLVSKSTGVILTDELEINLVLDQLDIRNRSYDNVLTISALTDFQTRIWRGRIYIGEPSDGCGLNNTANGDFDPDASILMLQFWRDSITHPEHGTTTCNLPKGAIDARSKGWNTVMFSCGYPTCRPTTGNLDYSLIPYIPQLRGMLIYYFYQESYEAIRILDQYYDIYVRIEPVLLDNYVSVTPNILIFMWIFVFFGLLCLGFSIYKLVLYTRIKGFIINHTVVAHLCNILACCSFIAFAITLWCFMYILSPYYVIWGMLSLGFAFVGSANFSLAMWWSGFLFPTHQKRFHSRILLGVIIGFYLAIGFTKLGLDRARSEAVVIFNPIAYVILFVVSIYTVIIGFIVTVKFIYSKPDAENTHIKQMKRREAQQLMALLLSNGFTVIGSLFMSIIFPLIVTETFFTWLSQYYFPAFFGLINVFLMTLLHNNTKKDNNSTRAQANSSIMAGSSDAFDSSIDMSSYTTR